jgi:hypothetical protein
MRGFGFLIAMLLAATAAQATPIYPNGALALESRLLAKMGPATRAWIKSEARHEVDAGDFTAAAQGEASARFNVPAADYPALSFLILMQAARDADDDVHAAVDSRNMASDQVAREEQLANVNNNYSKRDELSPGSDMAIQQNGAPTLLSSKLRDQDPATVGTTHPDQLATTAAPETKHYDMQTVMDRESDIEDTLAVAAKKVTPAVEAATQPIG